MNSVPQLPEEQHKTAGVVERMFVVRHWSFHKGETFGAIARRHLHNLLTDVPPCTDSMHLCCDRYRNQGLKA